MDIKRNEYYECFNWYGQCVCAQYAIQCGVFASANDIDEISLAKVGAKQMHVCEVFPVERYISG